MARDTRSAEHTGGEAEVWHQCGNLSSSLVLVLACCLLASCIAAGTHGSIKKYYYTVRHADLRSVVDRVLESNSAVLQRTDMTKNVLIYLHDGQSDTVVSEHPDARAYVDFRIIHERTAFNYCIHYGGSEFDWDTSKTSCLSIAYAWDDEGHGGSAGDGGVSWTTPFLKQKLLDVFENEFIQRIDSVLGVPAQARK